MALDEKTFLNICSKSLEKEGMGSTEKKIQLQIASALMDALSNEGCKIFTEYPYPENNKDECDVVITDKNDFLKPTHWIEIKPVWGRNECNYWSVQKFFGEAPFRYDIEKLNTARTHDKTSKAWFLVIIQSDEIPNPRADLEEPKARARLTPSHLAKGISLWSMNSRCEIKSIHEKNYHILLWSVEGYNKEAIKRGTDGIYRWSC